MSVTALLILTYILGSFFRVEDRRISIGLFSPEGRVSITSAQISIRKGDLTDKIYVGLGLSNSDPASDGLFILAIPDSFRVSKGPWLNAGFASSEKETQGGVARHFFRVKYGQAASLGATFNADVLKSDARELNLHISFNTSGGQTPPLSITIAGLDKSDVVSVDPPPKAEDRSSYALRWPVLPQESPVVHGLWLQLRDRASGYRTDFTLLIAGILIGIFSSLITSIIWELVREAEMRLRFGKMYDDAEPPSGADRPTAAP